MQIVIWGVGAVGLGLASALARQGEPVGLLGRNPETLERLAHGGIQRRGIFGDVQVTPDRLETSHQPDDLSDDPPDWLLVCTKAFSTPEIARALEPVAEALATKTRLLLCQNGWGNELSFLPFWPKDRLFHARIITGFHLRSPIEVEITAHAAPIALGSVFDGSPGSLEPLSPLARRISAGGIPTETTTDMHGVLWAKMLYNCSLNPLGAIAGRRYGELVADPTTRTLVEEIVREIFEVLDAAEVVIHWPDAEAYLSTFYADLLPPTAAHESSMLQDLRAGRPTEIEALCGAVERLASTHGVETPVVSAVAALVRSAEHRLAR